MKKIFNVLVVVAILSAILIACNNGDAGKVVEITSDKVAEKKIDNCNDIIFLECWMDNCGNCKAVAEDLPEIAKNNKDVKFYKINFFEVGKGEEYMSKAGIHGGYSTPVLIVFKNKQIVTHAMGYKTPEEIQAMIDQAKAAK